MTANSENQAIRPCGAAEIPIMLSIINAAAEAYRGVIPADRWHVPYMPADDLRAEIKAGVTFTGYAPEGELLGVMGIQRVRNVDLIRHAYVRPAFQSLGVGAKLLNHLCAAKTRPVLIGTWRVADWAIRFYERQGFGLVPDEAIAPLLRAYWNVPDRQIETSVVLASPILSTVDAIQLIDAV